MAANFIIAPEVELDITQAYGWYDDQRSGLGEEFLSCVDACIQRIRRMPEIHAKVHEEYRRALVRRFMAQEQPTEQETRLLRDMHNLMNITLAMHQYANDHDGCLPESLGETLPYVENWTAWTENEKPKATLSEKARLYLSSDDASQIQIPEQVTPAWINENTSYLYLAKEDAKLSDYSDLSKTVIAHGKLEGGYTIDLKNDGKAVLYPMAMLDGRSESHPKDKLRELLGNSVRK